MAWSLTGEIALQWAGYLWMLLGGVWLVMWFGMKRTKKLEKPWEILQHALPVALGFWLLFEKDWKWMNAKFPAGSAAIWWTGLLLTAAGVGISIWARLTLGANWSGVVTLKKNHELIRAGLYRWIRHPIYTGILLGMFGTAMIKGHPRSWLGLTIVFLAFYLKARREERFLKQEFGAGFDEHARHTGMFLPKFS